MPTIYTVLGSRIIGEWAADVPSNIFTDTAGTTLATNGDAVAAWGPTSYSLTSGLATQTTAGSRPIYRSNYASSGYPAIEFDGSNDGLLIPHVSAWNSTGVTAFCVCSADTISNWRWAWLRSPNQSWTGQGLGVQATNLSMFMGSAWSSAGAAFSINTKAIIWGQFASPAPTVLLESATKISLRTDVEPRLSFIDRLLLVCSPSLHRHRR